MSKTMEWYMFLMLVEATIIATTFDLWMFEGGGFDTFVLVVNYIKKKWEACRITIGIFEIKETLEVSMVVQLKDFLLDMSCWERS